MTTDGRQRRNGFTIVELIVVIAVVAILAGISVVGYGAWQTSARHNQVKNDLRAAASAMESARTFDGDYSLTIPDTYEASTGVQLTLSVPALDSYCIDGTHADDTSIEYYIDNLIDNEGAQEGTCAERSVAVTLSAPASASILGFSQADLSIGWSVVVGATGYELQCSPDESFIVLLAKTSISDGSTGSHTFADIDPASEYHCRVKAVNGAAQSAWTETGSGSSDGTYGSLPVGTSLEGYWTSAPDGYLLENGAAVSRTTYADLFAVIGTTFGAGDGSSTFNLPDSRGRTSVNRSATDTEFDTIGELPGSNTEQLTIAQIPSHEHDVPWLGSGSNVSDYLGGSGNAYGMSTSWASRHGSYNMLEPVGGNDAHNNIQPSIVKVFAIKYRPPGEAESTLPAGTSIQGYWPSAPTGYLLENDAEVSRTTYADLFAVIGTTYGTGNGSTTFNLPDSRGRAMVNRSASDSEFNSMGEKPGSKTEALTIAQIPSHTHEVPWLPSGSDVSDWLGGSYASYGLSTTWAGRQGSYSMLEPVGGGGTHNNIQRSIVKTFAIKYTPAASGVQEDSPTGTSIQGYWTSAPSGYLLEDGSAVSRTTYADLFAVIGTTYGAGNGSTTFNVPDSRGRLGVNRSSSYSEFDQMNDKPGAKSVTLTIAQLPSHDHDVPWLSSGDPSDYLGGSGEPFGLNQGWAAGNTYDMLEPVGGGGSHNNIQPSIVKMFAIKY